MTLFSLFTRPTAGLLPARRWRVVTLAATVALVAAPLTLLAPAAQASPATPSASTAVPAASSGTVVYAEDFSHQDAGTDAVNLLDYTGGDAAANMSYTADAQWTPAGNQCNGWVMGPTTLRPSTTQDAACSRNPGAWAQLQGMARALGLAQGQSEAVAGSNQVLSELTNHSSGKITPGVQFKTEQVDAIAAVPGHYYAVSAYFAEVNCFAHHAKMTFSLLVNDAVVDLSSGLDPCGTVTTGSTAVVTKLQSAAYQIPFGGAAELGLQLVNTTAQGNGNDVAFDLPQIVDVTPALSTSFSPELIAPGQTSTVTWTITNRTDLQEKTDWTISDTLPAGLVLAADPAFGGSCTNSSGAPLLINGVPGSDKITVTGGDSAAGQAACTITVDVTAAAEGSYTNGPENIVSNLIPPAPATLTVRAPRITLSEALGAPRQQDTDQFTTEIRSGGSAGTIVNNTEHSTTVGEGGVVTTGSGTTGSFLAEAGTPYTLTESAAGTTELGQYSHTITCVDTFGVQGELPQNAVFTGAWELTPVAGANIECVLTTSAQALINVAKQAASGSGPDDAGNFFASYTVTVTNSGSVAGSYGELLDTPAFADNLLLTGATWSTDGSGAPAAGAADTAGPYVLSPAATVIEAGDTHTYTVTITFRFADRLRATNCAGPNSGLFNAVALPDGQEHGTLADNTACMTPPVPPREVISAPVPPVSAPVPPVETVPAAPVPTQPIETTPATPVETTPTTPVETTPATPVETTPTTPVETTPATPVEATPATPVESVPTPPVVSVPVETTPVIPAPPMDVTPIEAAPVVDPAPAQPSPGVLVPVEALVPVPPAASPEAGVETTVAVAPAAAAPATAPGVDTPEPALAVTGATGVAVPLAAAVLLGGVLLLLTGRRRRASH